MELPMSLEGTDNWMGRHAASKVARALETTKPWVACERRRWRWRRDEVRFPRPHEVVDADEALAWAWRAERYASELTSTASVVGIVLSAASGVYLASLLLFLKRGEGEFAIFSVLIVVSLFLIRRRDVTLFSSDQHIWSRRAAALRQRADQLVAAAALPTAALPCRRWCCRLRQRPVRSADGDRV